MNFYDIKPYVRHSEQLKAKDMMRNECLASYDHLILYALSGNTKVDISESSYELSQGNVLLIKPGSFFMILPDEKSEIISIHFDFGNKNSIEKGFYIAPAPKENFNPGKICENDSIHDESCFLTNYFGEGFNNMEESFKQIVREFNKSEKYFDLRISCHLTSILIEISRRAMINANSNSATDDTAREVLDYIHKNFNQNITVDSLVEKFKFHATYINILVKKLTGYSIHKYIMVRRISKAIELLQYSDMRISEIAEKVGFPDASHFSKVFKQLMGKGPREFRKNE